MIKTISLLKRQIHRIFQVTFVAILNLALLFSWNSTLAADNADKIIVSGASGQLGGLVVEELLGRGVAPENLILISRTPEKLSDYADRGASVRFGDFNQPESLPAAYEGGDRMLLISIGGPDRPMKHKAAMDAAVSVGVKQIAYTSFVNMENNHSALSQDHRATEQFLRESGAAWTFLRNQIYMDSVVSQASQIAADGQVEVPPVEGKIAYVTRADCAAAAAAVLTTPGHENRAYDITGPAEVGASDIARAVTAITGQEIEIIVNENASPGFAAGIGGDAVRLSTNSVEVLTGRPATSLEQFLEANL